MITNGHGITSDDINPNICTDETHENILIYTHEAINFLIQDWPYTMVIVM